jgi:FkbM family methyltransferase
MKKMLIALINRALKPFAGKKQYQPFFEDVLISVLRCMNIGSPSVLVDTSGEKGVLKYIKKIFGNNDITIFDVGANNGDYVDLLVNVFESKAEIHSFEPSKKTFKKLLERHGNKEKVFFNNFGFGKEEASVILYSNSSVSGLSSVFKRKLEHLSLDFDEKEYISLRTVDSFCSEKGINHISLLKIDVEGSEMMVLEGSKKMIDSNSIDFIQFEFGGCNIDSKTFFQNFFYFLNDKYRIYRIVTDGLAPIEEYKEIYEVFICANFLAERKNMVKNEA